MKNYTVQGIIEIGVEVDVKANSEDDACAKASESFEGLSGCKEVSDLILKGDTLSVGVSGKNERIVIFKVEPDEWLVKGKEEK